MRPRHLSSPQNGGDIDGGRYERGRQRGSRAGGSGKRPAAARADGASSQSTQGRPWSAFWTGSTRRWTARSSTCAARPRSRSPEPGWPKPSRCASRRRQAIRKRCFPRQATRKCASWDTGACTCGAAPGLSSPVSARPGSAPLGAREAYRVEGAGPAPQLPLTRRSSRERWPA